MYNIILIYKTNFTTLVVFPISLYVRLLSSTTYVCKQARVTVAVEMLASKKYETKIQIKKQKYDIIRFVKIHEFPEISADTSLTSKNYSFDYGGSLF